MYETDEELTALQQLLEESRQRSTHHLRDIITDERALTAADLVTFLTGMKVLSVATVTARGEPRISALDGHFLHGTWTFSTSGTSAKAQHLQARPQVSVAHVDGERAALFAHGDAERMTPDDPTWEGTLAHWTAHYGSSPLGWGDDIRFYRLRPHWMVGYAWKLPELRAELAAKAAQPTEP